MNMLMGFKKFHNKILVHMKTFDVTIDHILDHFVGSRLGLYVSFLIPLYMLKYAYFSRRGNRNEAVWMAYHSKVIKRNLKIFCKKIVSRLDKNNFLQFLNDYRGF